VARALLVAFLLHELYISQGVVAVLHVGACTRLQCR